MILDLFFFYGIIATVIYARNNLWRYRLVVRTPGFHPGNRGPIPLSATIIKKHLFIWLAGINLFVSFENEIKN